MQKLKVMCSFIVEVEVPDDEEDGYSASFDIEENHCPGTGIVGAAVDALMKRAKEQGTCWACTSEGQNEIL